MPKTLIKKFIWRYAFVCLSVCFSIPGVYFMFERSYTDRNTFYLAISILFTLIVCLLYEYRKAYTYNKKLKGILNDCIKDVENKYQFTDPVEGTTAFYLDASDVIRNIEQGTVPLTSEYLKNLYSTYMDSPKIKAYISNLMNKINVPRGTS